MKGDITLTVRLNPIAQGHLSELIKLHPEKSRNKLIGLAIENASIEDEKEKIAIDVLEAHYQKRINQLLTRLAQRGNDKWNTDSDPKKWFEKAIRELDENRCSKVTFLVHLDTSTRWFHDYLAALMHSESANKLAAMISFFLSCMFIRFILAFAALLNFMFKLLLLILYHIIRSHLLYIHPLQQTKYNYFH